MYLCSICVLLLISSPFIYLFFPSAPPSLFLLSHLLSPCLTSLSLSVCQVQVLLSCVPGMHQLLLNWIDLTWYVHGLQLLLLQTHIFLYPLIPILVYLGPSIHLADSSYIHCECTLTLLHHVHLPFLCIYTVYYMYRIFVLVYMYAHVKFPRIYFKNCVCVSIHECISIGLSITVQYMMYRHWLCSHVYSNYTVKTSLLNLDQTMSTPTPFLLHCFLVHLPYYLELGRAPDTCLLHGRTLVVTSLILLVVVMVLPQVVAWDVLKMMRKLKRRRLIDKTVSCSMHCLLDRVMSIVVVMPTFSTSGSCWNRGQR